MTEFQFERPENFDIVQIFDCGQCFRFDAVGDSLTSQPSRKVYEGVAFGDYIKIEQDEKTVKILSSGNTPEPEKWKDFLDLGTDYAGISSSFSDDPILSKAAHFASGIRILKQDKWETLCSFIISQNNNIPRIKGIISAMSRRFGNKVFESEDGREFYSFPAAKALYDAGENEIFALKTGFRAKYIFDAAKRVCENPFFLTEVSGLDTPDAAGLLKQIRGVGDKVAACTLLFGFSRYDAFPIDVWVKKILTKYYPNGAAGHLSGKYAGIAQQYLFYFERCASGVFISSNRQEAVQTG